MFTWEIKNYVNERNGVVNREEFCHIINQVDNPQIKDVRKVGDTFSIKASDDSEEIIVSVLK